jgi:hypothetical protein
MPLFAALIPAAALLRHQLREVCASRLSGRLAPAGGRWPLAGLELPRLSPDIENHTKFNVGGGGSRRGWHRSRARYWR